MIAVWGYVFELLERTRYFRFSTSIGKDVIAAVYIISIASLCLSGIPYRAGQDRRFFAAIFWLALAGLFTFAALHLSGKVFQYEKV